MRADKALVESGLVRSRNQAAQLIAQQKVLLDGEPVTKASSPVRHDAVFELAEPMWVSRAGFKLLGALEQSGTVVSGRVLDAGASTGGFTDVCLAKGAQRVYAVDVGHDQLAEEIRTDTRVVVHEGLNIKDLTLAHVEGELVDLVVADVSFISLTHLLEPMLGVLAKTGQALLLVKPQFEVGRQRVGSGGVVRSDADRRWAVESVIAAAGYIGWRCDWQSPSALPGTNGNQEYFIRLTQ